MNQPNRLYRADRSHRLSGTEPEWIFARLSLLPAYGYLAVGREVPNKRPESIAGDKGYSCKAIRNLIARRSITAVIPSRSNETRSDSFDRASYRNRNIMERLIGWLKESRRIATRYDKLRCTYIAFVYLAAMRRAIALL